MTTPTPLGALKTMLRTAMAAKARERGGHYTYRELAQEIEEYTGGPFSFSHARNVIANPAYAPRHDVLVKVLRPLRGYIDEDAALLAGGYAPDGLRAYAAELGVLGAGAPGGDEPGLDAEYRELNHQFVEAVRTARAALARLRRLRPSGPHGGGPAPTTPGRC